MASVSIWEIWRHSPGEMVEVRGGGVSRQMEELLFVGPPRCFGSGRVSDWSWLCVLKPDIENKRRKIDSLTDDHEMGRVTASFSTLTRSKCPP